VGILRIYVETSVWSFAFADDAPDYQADTLAFFGRCRRNEIEPFVSGVVLDEIDRADPPLRARLIGLVQEIRPTAVDLTAKAMRLAEAFHRERVVPTAKPEDARHVAIGFAEELDALVSWNFRHIATLRRAERFNAIALLEGFYKPLRIVSPAEVLYDDGTDPTA
jgi:hypothetical protein